MPLVVLPMPLRPFPSPDLESRSTIASIGAALSFLWVIALTPAMVYDDQFVYANDRYKMAGQWFGLPKLFPKSENLGYEIVRNDDTLIQFKNKQVSDQSGRAGRRVGQPAPFWTHRQAGRSLLSALRLQALPDQR